MFQLNPQQAKDLQTVAQVSPEDLAKIANHLEGLTQSPLLPGELVSAITTIIEEESAEVVARFSVFLCGLARISHQSGQELLSDLSKSYDPPDGETENWELTKAGLARLVDSPQIKLVSKGIGLAYEHASLYRSGLVLTDIRPIFNEDISGIDGAIVSFSLQISYEEARREKALSMALDMEDIESLAKQLERAIKKAKTAKSSFASLEKPIAIIGE